MDISTRTAMMDWLRNRIMELQAPHNRLTEGEEAQLVARVLAEIHTLLQQTAPANRPTDPEVLASLDLQETG